MSLITQVTHTNPIVVNVKQGELLPDGEIANQLVSDLRFTFTFTLQGAAAKDIVAKVSYKKHLAESYKNIGDYSPTASTTSDNTLTDLSLSEFTSAFGHYGDHLAQQMTGKDTDTLNPSAIPPFLTPEQINFWNNNDRFGKWFHCFPAKTTGSARVVDLPGRELMDFTALMRFLFIEGYRWNDSFSENNTRYVAAKQLYQKYHTQAWFQLLTDSADRERLRKLLDPNEASGKELVAKYQTQREQESESKQFVSRLMQMKL